MSKTNAAYMRDYRARKKLAKTIAEQTPEQALAEARSFVTDYVALYNDTARERDQLRDEIHHLKEELAKRPSPKAHEIETATRTVQKRMNSEQMLREEAVLHGYSTRPFTPVPKKGK